MAIIIETKNMTKEYTPTTGCFDINLQIKEGSVFGFIGPNGAGKTTVIRQLVGFIKSQKGSGTILGHDVWKNTKQIMEHVGYVPGEPALPLYMKGRVFLKSMANIRGGVDLKYLEKLIKYFDIEKEVDKKIKKMSKGMKQKIAIINAFVHKPKILILDEPSSGLDPLMQEKINKLIEQAQADKTTIFLSSHIFGEISSTCDEVAFIKNGHIVSQISMVDLKNYKEKVFEFLFDNKDDYNAFKKIPFTIVKSNVAKNLVEVSIKLNEIDKFKDEIKNYKYKTYKEMPFNLERHFVSLYGSESDISDL
ncbi:ABC transporter ATP-binding protein [Spiroplasma endosymbiont of Amphibalanus improvisus]|uniref:ABC transporter ATP-binding protein n=1 Tax=Spiroplasma endosymbiont of Amphibalanus improvisus TaxID=3066327 RepID=UPI00313C1C50